MTNFYNQGIQDNPCSGYSIVTNVGYKIVSAKQLAESASSKYYNIDIRNDSAFNGKSTDEQIKTEGRFVNAVNIPFQYFEKAMKLYPEKEILLVDDYGDQSPVAAKMLMDKGFKDVSILFNGMDGWVHYTINTIEKPSIAWKSFSSCKMISADELTKWVNAKKSFTLIDVRPKDQFLSQSKNYWQNTGQIENAHNIPFAELKNNSSLPSSKTDEVLVYGFNNEKDVFDAAKWLQEQGYKNVFVLEGGIFSLRWEAHNLKGKMYLNDLIVHVLLKMNKL